MIFEIFARKSSHVLLKTVADISQTQGTQLKASDLRKILPLAVYICSYLSAGGSAGDPDEEGLLAGDGRVAAVAAGRRPQRGGRVRRPTHDVAAF